MDSAQAELPKYKCHKEVWALKIEQIGYDSDVANMENRDTDGSANIYHKDDRYGKIKVDANYLKKHKPEVGGYYVVYEDGYESYSPAKAFESGYVLINKKTTTEKNITEEIQYLGDALGATTIKDYGRILAIIERLSKLLGDDIRKEENEKQDS